MYICAVGYRIENYFCKTGLGNLFQMLLNSKSCPMWLWREILVIQQYRESAAASPAILKDILH